MVRTEKQFKHLGHRVSLKDTAKKTNKEKERNRQREREKGKQFSRLATSYVGDYRKTDDCVRETARDAAGAASLRCSVFQSLNATNHPAKSFLSLKIAEIGTNFEAIIATLKLIAA